MGDENNQTLSHETPWGMQRWTATWGAKEEIAAQRRGRPGAPRGGDIQAAPGREEVNLELGAGQGDYEVRLRGYKKYQYCVHSSYYGCTSNNHLLRLQILWVRDLDRAQQEGLVSALCCLGLGWEHPWLDLGIIEGSFTHRSGGWC